MTTELFGDPTMRVALAKTIHQYHKVRVNWKKHSYHDLQDLYQRLNLAQNIKTRWNVDVEWGKLSVDELRHIWQFGPK